MATTSQSGYYVFAGAGATTYAPCANTYGGSGISIENSTKITYRTSGTLSKFYANVYFNDLGATSTYRVRKNGANGNQILSIGSSTTGEFEDVSNTDTVSAGDQLNYSLVGGAGGSFIVTVPRILFAADANTLIRHASTGTPTLSIGSTTYFFPIAGSYDVTETTEARVKFDFNTAGTLKNLLAIVEVNVRGTACTAKSRVNGADGNLSISVTASTTGSFEDTSNSDSISINDDVNYSFTTGSGGGSLGGLILSAEFLTTNNKFHHVAAETSAASVNFGTSNYIALGGWARKRTAESSAFVDIGIGATLSNLYCYIKANTVNGSTTCNIRKNASNSSVTISIGSSTTGAFEDTSNTEDVVSSDQVNYGFFPGGSSGSISLEIIGCMIETVGASPSLSLSLSPSASQSESLSISPSPSVSVSLSISLSPSSSASESLSISLSPSLSESFSISPSPSVSVSLSQSLSLSLSPSASQSESLSISLSSSVSVSLSPSASQSESLSISPSPSVSVSLSDSLSISLSPSSSASESLSISLSPSASQSQSLSISLSPSVSISASSSLSISLSPSLSLSPSPSLSESLSFSPSPSVSVSLSQSLSISLSPSASQSESLSISLSSSISESASISLSPSLSQSPSPSLSISLSPSVSASASDSLSISLSPSASQSESLSISLSPSLSLSLSPSISESVSISPSPSVSVSLSESLSISPSPSPGTPDVRMCDDFDDNSIDATKWDETDPDGVIAETNQQLEISNPHTSVTDYGDNILLSKTTIESGVAVAQAYVDWADEGVNEAIAGFALWVDANNFAFMGSRSTNGGEIILIIQDGGSTVYANQNTGIANAKDFKITYDIGSSDIKFWYWNGSAWVQIGSTQNYDIGSVVKLGLTSQDDITYARADLVAIDDVCFTRGDYTTNPPVGTTPSISLSASLSPSASISLSPSVSESLSPSSSVSESLSISLSPSASQSPSSSDSASPSLSISLSPSVSQSLSISLSPSFSISLSPSVSQSLSISLSPSLSLSLSPSLSISLSSSLSSSLSISSSISPSPSPPVYTDKYAIQNTAYSSCYEKKNTAYSDKYEKKNTVYTPKYREF